MTGHASIGDPLLGDPGPTDGLLYRESLRATAHSWWWCAAAVGITFFAIAPLVVPFTLLAWAINVGRYRNITIRIDRDYAWVGHRWVRLVALDPPTLGRASNTWPWRSFNSRYLGANPIWTRDSLGIRGQDGKKRVWFSVGTNRRDELTSVLVRAINDARSRAGEPTTARADLASPPRWHDDPWDPVGHLRWWDGQEWTGFTWPKGVGAETPGSGVTPTEIRP